MSSPEASEPSPAPTGYRLDASQPFNATVNVTIDGWSPMMDLDSGGYWWLDETTGIWEAPPVTPDQQNTNGMAAFFVCTGYVLHGSAKWANESAATHQDPAPARNLITSTEDGNRAIPDVWVDSPNIMGAAADLNLSLYTVTVLYGLGAELRFKNATIQIPIKAQE